jgi:hypothetical protein
MDKWIQELEELTQSNLDKLPNMSSAQVSEFMDQRSVIIDGLLQLKLGPQEKQIYRKRIDAVLSYDALFLSKMEFFKEEAREQLNKLDNARTQRKAYNSAYDVESFFIDKKK